MKYEFEFKNTFVGDYNTIVENLSEHALQRFSSKLSSKIKQIIAFPESCPRLKEPQYFESGIRWVPILGKYILVYLFDIEVNSSVGRWSGKIGALIFDFLIC